MFGLLFVISFIACFQIIAPQYYNYDIHVSRIIWQQFFHVE